MKIMLYFLMTSLAASSCSDSGSGQSDFELPPPGNSGTPPPPVSATWSIPVEQVLDGGPGKDGIPALTEPELVPVSEAVFMSDSDLVLGYQFGSDVRAYPHLILDWHEIINDDVSGIKLAVTYCPLTGTGIGWNRLLKGVETTFGVSGLLYNTNLIPYDRATDSNWSQILNEAVNGDLLGTSASLIPLVETTWGTWKRMFPFSRVVSTNTGFSRTYGFSPYGDYNTNNDRFLFPVPKDTRLPLKERVLAIVDDSSARVYRFESFTSGQIVKDTFKGNEYMIVGNSHFMVSFRPTGAHADLVFEYIWDENSRALLRDNEGSTWDIFGVSISGPRNGQVLTPAKAFMGFWFSIPAFYNTSVYN